MLQLWLKNYILGATNTKGMCYGNPSNYTDRMKLFGLEDLWGNVCQMISGLYSDSNRNLLTTTDNFGVNTSADAWEYNVSSDVTSNIEGFMRESQGANNSGFVAKTVNHSTLQKLQYYTDRTILHASSFPVVGGSSPDNGSYAGMFCCFMDSSALSSSTYYGSRLMYL